MGEHGTTKTTFALRFPDPGVLDLDQNLDGPDGWLRRQKLKVSYEYVQPLLNAAGKPLENDRILRDAVMDGLDELVKSPKVRTIIVDSATKLGEILVFWRLAAEGRELMEISMWQPWRSAFIKLVHRGRNAGKNFILIVHEEPVYAPRPPKSVEAPPKVGVAMSLATKLREQFGFAFTDVWRAVKLGKGGSLKYELRFISDGEASLKNSLGLTEPMEMKWENLAPHLKGRI
jgi:hypothetical protein